VFLKQLLFTIQKSVSNTVSTYPTGALQVPTVVYFRTQLQTLNLYSGMIKVTILTKISQTFDNSFAERLFILLYIQSSLTKSR